MKFVVLPVAFLLFSRFSFAEIPDFSRFLPSDFAAYFQNVATAIYNTRRLTLLSPIPNCTSIPNKPILSPTDREFPYWTKPFPMRDDPYYTSRNFQYLGPICSLGYDEYLALTIYTDVGYAILNPKLIENTGVLPAFSQIVEHLKSALRKTPRYHGLVLRGASFREFEYIMKHTKDGIYELKSFLSTSLPTYTVYFESNSTQMIVLSKTCSFIGTFSTFKHEEEVLCPPGLKFQVWWNNNRGNGRAKLIMEEIIPNDDFSSKIESPKST